MWVHHQVPNLGLTLASICAAGGTVQVLGNQGSSVDSPMASTSSATNVRRHSSNSLALLLARDFEEEHLISSGHAAAVDDLDFDRPLSRGLAKTKQLIRTVSRRMTKRNDATCPVATTATAADDTINAPDVSSGCLRLYSRGTGCKVGACEEFDFLGGGGTSSSRAKSTPAGDECLPHQRHSIMPRIEAMLLPRFRRRSFKKEKTAPGSPPPIRPSTPDQQQVQFALPDDVLEMCLVRLPLSTLMTARLVCRRWRALSSTPHFIQMRAQGSYQTPWLFLFGIAKNGCQPGGETIHALDVSMDRWHRITAGFLQGRYLFSIAAIGTHLYVVGGCSSLQHRYHSPTTITMGINSSSSSRKTHKSVFMFNPLTGSWSKAASMKCSRSGAVLGVVHVRPSYPAFNCRQSNHQPLIDRHGRRAHRTRIGGVSDVYEDPHRCSLRRHHQLREDLSDSDDDGTPDSRRTTRKPSSSSSLKLDKSHDDNKRYYALIAVGGMGSLDEPLDSAEIYDPTTNRWLPIAKLPPDFGVASSGAACNGVFYVYSDTDKLVGYSLESGTWTTIHVSPPLPPRLQEYFPKLVSCNDGQLLLITVSWAERSNSRWASNTQRSSTDKAIRKMWKLTFSSSSSSLSWTEVSRHPDAPMDFNAEFVGQNGSIYGVEMFRIFGQLLSFITVCNVSESGCYRWSRISRNRSALEADAASCKAKAMAVLQL